MKRIASLIILILFSAALLMAQSKTSSYKADGRSFDVYAYYSSSDLITLIEGQSSSYSNTYCLVLKNERVLVQFIAELKKMKMKYNEWSEVARNNKVKRFSKDIPLSFPQLFVADRYTSEMRDYHEVNVKYATRAEFYVDDEGKPLVFVTLRSDWIAFKDTRYTTEWRQTFTSSYQIDGLIKALELKTIKAKAGVAQRDKLFK